MAQRKGISTGTTAQRSIEEAGKIRFNTTTSLLEYYDGNAWKPVDSPPVVTSVDNSNLNEGDGTGNYTIVVTGSGFSQTVTAKLITDGGTEISPDSVSRDSANQVTITTAKDTTNLTDANEPFDVKIINSSGLSSTLENALNLNATPYFNTAAGTIANIFDSNRSGFSTTIDARDSESGTLNFSVTTGALPSGLSLNATTGVISGTADAVGSNTTSTFQITAKDSASNFAQREFSIIVYAPVITSFTSSGTFTVPSGLSAVDVLVVAGGGAGGTEHSGGGGAGGLIYRPAFPITPGSPISVTVGDGGQGYSQNRSAGQGPAQGFAGDNGQDSVFSTLTAKGGGGGGTWGGGQPVGDAGPQNHREFGRPGGSGGGGSDDNADAGPSQVGTGIQPTQSGESGNYGFGNPGGYGNTSNLGGAGGGAGAAGEPGDGNAAGGVGKQYSISGTATYYAGGGGGGGPNPGPLSRPAGGQGGGGEGGWSETSNANFSGTNATANRGGGGGGGYNDEPGFVVTAGQGGKGIVIVKY